MAEPMIKLHGFGQELYTNIYIGVYRVVAKVAGYILKFLRNYFGDAPFSLSTWSLLCDGQRGSNVVFPFQSPARCRDTVVRVLPGD